MRELFFLSLSSLILSVFYAGKSLPDDRVHIFFCDVGQGDGIFITHNSYQIIIDGGPDNKMSSCVQKYMPVGDQVIEVMVASHNDSDHIAGLPKILQDYQVQAIYTHAYGKKTQVWERFRIAVRDEVKEGAILHQPLAGETIIFDPLLSTLILNPTQKKGSLDLFTQDLSETQLSAIYEQQAKEFNSTNNESIALFLYIQQVKIVFTADLEVPIELSLTSSHLLEPVNVLKAGHHGSKTSNSRQFLNFLQPEAVVVSVGEKNRYGHPNPEVMSEFRQRNLSIFRTDQMGTVEMISDGEKYWFKQHP